MKFKNMNIKQLEDYLKNDKSEKANLISKCRCTWKVDKVNNLIDLHEEVEDLLENLINSQVKAWDINEEFIGLKSGASRSSKILDRVIPIRKGTSTAVSAEAGAGKTTLIQNWIKDQNSSSKTLLLQIGERQSELKGWNGRVDKIYGTTNKCTRVETTLNEVLNLINDIEAEINSGNDVILVIDSITRVIKELSCRYFTEIGEKMPATAGGLSLKAYDLSKQLFGLAGKYGNNYVTVVGTLLDANDKANEVIVDQVKSIGHALITLCQPKKTFTEIGGISVNWKGVFDYREGDQRLMERIAKIRFDAEKAYDMDKVNAAVNADLLQ